MDVILKSTTTESTYIRLSVTKGGAYRVSVYDASDFFIGYPYRDRYYCSEAAALRYYRSQVKKAKGDIK